MLQRFVLVYKKPLAVSDVSITSAAAGASDRRSHSDLTSFLISSWDWQFFVKII
jgi:hypothetical protein